MAIKELVRDFPLAKLKLIYLIFLSLFMGTLLFANDSEMGSDAFSVYPINSNKIAMVSESVYIDIPAATVDCNFIFWNPTQESLEILIGFPGHEEPEYGDFNITLRDFHSYVDGKPVEVTIKRDTATTRIWYTKKVLFEPNTTKRVRNTYKVNYSVSINSGFWFSYIMKTGANWKGKIGRADVYMYMGRSLYEVTQIEPKNYVIKDKTIEWHFENFEPKEDISINCNYVFNQMYFMKVKNEEIIGEQRYKPIQITKTEYGEMDPFWIHAGFCYTKQIKGKKIISFPGVKDINLKRFKEMQNPVSYFWYSGIEDFICSAKEDDNFDIYNIKDDTVINLTSTPEYDEFSPTYLTEKRIAYYAVDKQGNSDIWIGGIKITNKIGKCRNPSAFTDRTGTIYFECEKDGNTDIYSIYYDGTQLKRLSHHPGYDGEPAVYDNRIAFVSDRSGNKDIWLMDTTGDNLIQVTTNPSDDNSPTWLRLGDYILFTSTRNQGINHIFLVPIRTKLLKIFMPRRQLSNVLLNEAREFGKKGRVKESKEKYFNLINKYPETENVDFALFDLAKIFASENDTVRCLECLYKILGRQYPRVDVLSYTSSFFMNLDMIDYVLCINQRIVNNTMYQSRRKSARDGIMKILKSKIPPNYPFNTKILLSNNVDELTILCKRIVDEFPGTQSEMLALLELAKISAIDNDTTKSIEYLGKINSNKRATKPLLLFSGLILENLGKYIEALAIYYEIIIKSDSPIWLKTSQDRINQILHSDGFRKKYPFWRRFIIHLRYMFKIRRLLSKK